MDGGDIHHGMQPQEEFQRRTALQQWWKHSEDTVFPVLRSHRGQNSRHMLQNHSNLKTLSQHISAFQSIQQRPEIRYRPTMQDISPTMSWHTKALPLEAMGPRLAASTMPTLYMGNLVMRLEGGSTRGYLKTYRRHLRGLWTLNPGSLPSSASIPGRSMRSTTLMSAVTIRSLRSVRLNMSETLTIKVRITIQIIKRTNIAIITIPTALTTTRTAPTTTTPPAETSGTKAMVTTQRYHQA